jgi:hypothetical protein
VFPFGDAPFDGDTRLAGVFDIVGIAATAPPLPPDLIGLAARGAITANRPVTPNATRSLVAGRGLGAS